jgi:hypothetical protein
MLTLDGRLTNAALENFLTRLTEQIDIFSVYEEAQF